MQRRGSNHRLPSLLFRSRISYVMLAMFATMSAVYVAGRWASYSLVPVLVLRILITVISLIGGFRLWQDAQNRVYLIKELDRRTGKVRSFTINVVYLFIILICCVCSFSLYQDCVSVRFEREWLWWSLKVQWVEYPWFIESTAGATGHISGWYTEGGSLQVVLQRNGSEM